MSKPAKQAKSDNSNVTHPVQLFSSNNLQKSETTECSKHQESDTTIGSDTITGTLKTSDKKYPTATVVTTNKSASNQINMTQSENVNAEQQQQNIPKISTPKSTQKLSAQTSQEWVNLNVGGTIITTTKTTLMKYSDINDHFLAKLISDNDLPSATDEKGAFLVDRNPEYFKHVVNFLRNGRLDVPIDCTLEGILSEAEFCNLRELVNLCKLRILERDMEIERRRSKLQQNQKRVIYRVLQSSATELTQMISTLSESWRLQQILSLNTDAAAAHANQMTGVGGNEYLVVVSQEQMDGDISLKKNGSTDETFSNCNEKVKALSGSLSAHTITTLYR